MKTALQLFCLGKKENKKTQKRWRNTPPPPDYTPLPAKLFDDTGEPWCFLFMSESRIRRDSCFPPQHFWYREVVKVTDSPPRWLTSLWLLFCVLCSCGWLSQHPWTHTHPHKHTLLWWLENNLTGWVKPQWTEIQGLRFFWLSDYFSRCLYQSCCCVNSIWISMVPKCSLVLKFTGQQFQS